MTDGDRLDDLEDRITQLEEENQQLRSLIEFRGDAKKIEDLWIDGIPVGKAIQLNSDHRQDDQLDGTDVDATPKEDQLPIQQYTAVRKQEGREAFARNQTNLYRATYVWEAFQAHSTRDAGGIKLTSSQVRNILADQDGLGFENPNSNTIKRIMQNLAKYSGRPSELPDDVTMDDPDLPYHPELLVTFRDDTAENVLWADPDEWDDCMTQLADASGDDDGTDDVEFDESIFDAEPVTNPAQDTVESSMETDP